MEMKPVIFGMLLRTMMFVRNVNGRTLAKKMYVPAEAITMLMLDKFAPSSDLDRALRAHLDWPTHLDPLLQAIYRARIGDCLGSLTPPVSSAPSAPRSRSRARERKEDGEDELADTDDPLPDSISGAALA
jgi:hypothetical protein